MGLKKIGKFLFKVKYIVENISDGKSRNLVIFGLYKRYDGLK